MFKKRWEWGERFLPIEVGVIAVLTVLCFANFWVDDVSRPPRLTFFLAAFLGALRYNRLTLYVILATCCWYEIPTLLAGYTNQFVIEFAVLGFLGGSLVKDAWAPAAENSVAVVPQRHHRLLIYYPLALPAIACILYGLFSLPPILAELETLNNVPLAFGKTFWRAMRVGFDWNPAEPLHVVSLINGYALHLVFLSYLINRSSYYRFTSVTIVRCLLWGSFPISAYAMAQYLAPATFMPPFHALVVGSLQGSNSLSFYMGLVLLGSMFLARTAEHRSDKILAHFAKAATFLPFLIGRGRTAWLAFGLALLVLVTLHQLSRRRGAPCWRQGLGVWPWRSFVFSGLSLGGVLLGGALVWSWIGVEIEQTILQYGNAIREGQWRQLFIPVSRYEDYQNAWTAFLSEPWFGIGLGNYFVKNPASYDLHSMLMFLPVHLGLAGVIVMGLTTVALGRCLVISLRNITSATVQASSSLWLIVFFSYVIATFAYDVYLNYRSIAFMVAVILLAFIREVFGEQSLTLRDLRLGRRFWGATILVSFGMGMASMGKPLTHYELFRIYPKEESTGTPFSKFQWASLADAIPLAPNQCLTQWMKPFANHRDQGLGILVGASRSLPGRHFKLRGLLTWEEQELVTSQQTFLSMRQWSKVCICQTQSASQALYLRSHQVRTYAFIEDEIADQRMLAFAFAERLVLSRKAFDESQTGVGTVPCDQVLTL